MTLAGTPATFAPAGTSIVTTAPAPTTALSPIVTPFNTITPAPSQTSEPIRTGAARKRLVMNQTARHMGMVVVCQVTIGTDTMQFSPISKPSETSMIL